MRMRTSSMCACAYACDAVDVFSRVRVSTQRVKKSRKKYRATLSQVKLNWNTRERKKQTKKKKGSESNGEGENIPI